MTRLPGNRWRVKADRKDGSSFEARDDGTFDELVVDGWIHLEQMSALSWWMQLGPLRFWITMRANGDVDIAIGRDRDDIGGVVRVGPGVDTAGKRLAAAALPPAKFRERKDGKLVPNRSRKERKGWAQ